MTGIRQVTGSRRTRGESEAYKNSSSILSKITHEDFGVGLREEIKFACLVVQLCLTPCDPLDCSPPGSSVRGIFSGKNTGMGCHFLLLLQGIFPTQELNLSLLCLLHCRRILHLLSHQGNPKQIKFSFEHMQILSLQDSRSTPQFLLGESLLLSIIS